MKIKGNVLLSRIAFVKEEFGEPVWQQVLAHLGAEDRTTLDGFVTPAGWYPFEMEKRLTDAIIQIVGKGDIRIFERMGVTSAKKNLTTVHKHFIEPGNPQGFLAKASLIYRFYYDQGYREYQSTGPTSGVLTTHDAETRSQADCHTVIGWYREALGMCGAKDVHIVEECCRAKGSDVCRYRVDWK